MAIIGLKYTDFSKDFFSDLALWRKFYLGLDKFYFHPYKRNLSLPDTIWQLGSAKLVAFPYHKNRPNLLIIPSLINKSYILDLKLNNSLVRFLADDINIIILEWNNPIAEELSFNFSDYITKRVLPAIEFISQERDNIAILGYCLGGLMAIATSILSKCISALVLFATPWDFSEITKFQYSITKGETVPFMLIQQWFYLNTFSKVFKKFVAFEQYEQNSEQAENFVATEHWVRDGIDVNKKVIDQLVKDFMENNIASNNNWFINCQNIVPQNIHIPCFIALPQYDNLVPISSSKILVNLLPNNNYVIVPSGHVGMVVGKSAMSYLWQPLKTWLLKNNS